MATWQQGNAGSFLAGIGQNNSNAPQASDANAALSLIRSNNDLARSGQNNLGVQLSGAVNSIAGAYKSGQQQLRQQQFQQAFGQAYAKGDRDALKQLAASNPDQIEAIQKGMGFIDADKNQQIGAASMDLQLAAQSGNPQAVASAIQKNAGVLQGLGLDPQTAFQAYQQDPQNFSKTADLIGMHALGPEKYFDFQDKAAGRSIQRDTLAETQRSNQAGEALTSRGQDIAMRGQNISASNSAADREIRLMQLKQDSLIKQAANETNDLKRQELQQKIDDNKQQVQEKQAQINQGKDMSYEAAKLARNIASNPQLDVITGSIQSRLPKFEGESLDLINQAQQLQSMLTAGNLGLLKGAMSDKDIDFLKSMSSGLNVGDNGIKGSYKATQAKLNQIASKLEANLGGYTPPSSQQTGQAIQTDDDLLNKYLGGR